MADGYDRFENEGSGGGSFVMGLLTGTVLGAGLGMLFAPKAGLGTAQSALRAGRQPRQPGVGRLPQGRPRTRGDWADRRAATCTARRKDAVAKGADEAQKYVRDNAGTMRTRSPRVPTRRSSTRATSGQRRASTACGSASVGGDRLGERAPRRTPAAPAGADRGAPAREPGPRDRRHAAQLMTEANARGPPRTWFSRRRVWRRPT